MDLLSSQSKDSSVILPRIQGYSITEQLKPRSSFQVSQNSLNNLQLPTIHRDPRLCKSVDFKVCRKKTLPKIQSEPETNNRLILPPLVKQSISTKRVTKKKKLISRKSSEGKGEHLKETKTELKSFLKSERPSGTPCRRRLTDFYNIDFDADIENYKRRFRQERVNIARKSWEVAMRRERRKTTVLMNSVTNSRPLVNNKDLRHWESSKTPTRNRPSRITCNPVQQAHSIPSVGLEIVREPKQPGYAKVSRTRLHETAVSTSNVEASNDKKKNICKFAIDDSGSLDKIEDKNRIFMTQPNLIKSHTVVGSNVHSDFSIGKNRTQPKVKRQKQSTKQSLHQSKKDLESRFLQDRSRWETTSLPTFEKRRKRLSESVQLKPRRSIAVQRDYKTQSIREPPKDKFDLFSLPKQSDPAMQEVCAEDYKKSSGRRGGMTRKQIVSHLEEINLNGEENLILKSRKEWLRRSFQDVCRKFVLNMNFIAAMMDKHSTQLLYVNPTVQTDEKSFSKYYFKQHFGVQHSLTKKAKEILQTLPSKRTEQDIDYIYTLVKSFPCLRKFPSETRMEIARYASYETFGQGRVLLKDGHKITACYFLLSGCVVAHQGRVKPEEIEQDDEREDGDSGAEFGGEFRPGASFGDIAILKQSTQDMTVVTKSRKCEVLRIAREDFEPILQRHLRQEKTRNFEGLLMMPMFRLTPHAVLHELINKPGAVSRVTFSKNEVLKGGGNDPGNQTHFCYILSGECYLSKDVYTLKTKLRRGKSVISKISTDLSELTDISMKQKGSKLARHVITALTLGPGCAFSVGENFSNTYIVAKTVGEYMMVQKSELDTSQECDLMHERNALEGRMPSNEAMLQKYRTNRQWFKYRKSLVNNVWSKLKKKINTSLDDVPRYFKSNGRLPVHTSHSTVISSYTE